MEVNSVENRYKYYYKYSKNSKTMDVDDNYMNYVMSRVIILTNTSELLKFMLEVISKSIKFLFKYVDRVKNFKNYLKYNR